jgi:hypothetical protein
MCMRNIDIDPNVTLGFKCICNILFYHYIILLNHYSQPFFFYKFEIYQNWKIEIPCIIMLNVTHIVGWGKSTPYGTHGKIFLFLNIGENTLCFVNVCSSIGVFTFQDLTREKKPGSKI